MANVHSVARGLEQSIIAEPLGESVVPGSLQVLPLPVVDDPDDKRFVGTEPILLPYQQRWVSDPADVKIAEKSRRIGLTWGEASDDVLIAAAAGGQDVMYAGYNQGMTLEYIETCAQWTRAYGTAAKHLDTWLVDDEGKQVQIFRIRFASGKKIIALSSRPENLRGRQGVFVMDEAAFHKSVAAMLKAGLAFLMWGGKVRIISTHDGAHNPFNELVLECRAGKRPFSVHRITFGDALRDGLYRRICQKLGREYSIEAERTWRDEIYAYYGDGAAEELDVIPSAGSGAYLSMALLDQRAVPNVPVVRFELPESFMFQSESARELEIALWCELTLGPLVARMDPALRSFFGKDVGRSGDLSVDWFLQQRRDGVRAPAFVLELRNVPFSAQEQILWWVCDRVPRFSGGKTDATGNGAQLGENTVLRYGSMVEAVKISETFYRERVPAFKQALEDGEFLLPNDPDLLNDLRAIRLVHGVPKIDDKAPRKGRDGRQRHADGAIAAVLAHASTIEAIAEYRYEGVPRVGGVAQSMADRSLSGRLLGFDDGGPARRSQRGRGF